MNIACPRCKRLLVWEPERIGKPAVCPACKNLFVVPKDPADLPAEPPAYTSGRQQVSESAPTEEEARAKLKSRIPIGAHILREWSTGKRAGHVQAVAADERSAASAAQANIPARASILGKKTIRQVVRDIRVVKAGSDEAACKATAWQLKGELESQGIILSVRVRSESTDLSTPSARETVGELEITVRRQPRLFSPNRYEVQIRYAIVRIDYEEPAEAHVEFGGEIDCYLYNKDWKRLAALGIRGVPALLAALVEFPGSTNEVLRTLKEVDKGQFMAAALRVMTAGGFRAEDARDLLNEDRDWDDQYVTCPNCSAYMGVRADLTRSGRRIDDRMRSEASRQRVDIIGDFVSRCPKCGADVIVA